MLSSVELQERHTLQTIQTAYEEERGKVEHEWEKGRELIRKRLFEGIEERRGREREEKDGEGAVMGEYWSPPFLRAPSVVVNMSANPCALAPQRAAWIHSHVLILRAS